MSDAQWIHDHAQSALAKLEATIKPGTPAKPRAALNEVRAHIEQIRDTAESAMSGGGRALQTKTK